MTRRNLYIRVALLTSAIVAVLIIDFRAGYRVGKGETKFKTVAVFNDAFASENANALKEGLRVLSLAEKHPACFEKNELQYWRGAVEGWKKDVQKYSISYYTKKGEQQRATELRGVVKEADRLMTKLSN